MPFMVVSDDDFAAELHKLSQDNNKAVEHPSPTMSIEQIERGRGNTPEVPMPLRDVIAEEKLSGTSSKALQEIFKVSPASISAYANGATSTATYYKPVDALTKVRNRVSSRAANRLNEALKALGNKDLSDEKAKDLSAIAKDMAVVFDKISPVKQKENEEDKSFHLHLYAPKMKSVDDYEIIDI